MCEYYRSKKKQGFSCNGMFKHEIISLRAKIDLHLLIELECSFYVLYHVYTLSQQPCISETFANSHSGFTILSAKRYTTNLVRPDSCFHKLGICVCRRALFFGSKATRDVFKSLMLERYFIFHPS